MDLNISTNASNATNATNVTAECWNPRHIYEHEPNSLLHFVFAYFLPILVSVGTVANVLTLIALNAGREEDSKYKSNLFLMAKAVADLLHGFFVLLINISAYEYYVNDEDFSKFYYHQLKIPVGVILNFLIMSSTWYAVAVTFERMFVVHRPLVARYVLTTQRCIAIIAVLAMICLLTTLYPAFTLRRVSRITCKGQIVYRAFGPPPEARSTWLFMVVARFTHQVMATLLPVALLILFNSLLVYHLREHKMTLARFSDAGYNVKDAREHIRLSLVVFTITAATATFLLPSATVALYDMYNRGQKPEWYAYFVNVCNFLIIMDKVIDFFLYCLVSEQFRKRLKEAFRRWRAGSRRCSAKSQDIMLTRLSLSEVHEGNRKVSYPLKEEANKYEKLLS